MPTRTKLIDPESEDQGCDQGRWHFYVVEILFEKKNESIDLRIAAWKKILSNETLIEIIDLMQYIYESLES